MIGAGGPPAQRSKKVTWDQRLPSRRKQEKKTAMNSRRARMASSARKKGFMPIFFHPLLRERISGIYAPLFCFFFPLDRAASSHPSRARSMGILLSPAEHFDG